MKEKHTPEPWGPKGWPPVISHIESATILSTLDYERARACVNACAGIENPEKIKDLVEAAEKAITIMYFGCRGINGLRAALRGIGKLKEIEDTPKKKDPGRWD